MVYIVRFSQVLPLSITHMRVRLYMPDSLIHTASNQDMTRLDKVVQDGEDEEEGYKYVSSSRLWE